MRDAGALVPVVVGTPPGEMNRRRSDTDLGERLVGVDRGAGDVGAEADVDLLR